MAFARFLFIAGGICIGWAACSDVAKAATLRLGWATFMRTQPYQTARVIDELSRGSVIDLGACSARWCRVAVQGASGYIDKDAVSFTPPPDGAGKISQAQPCFWDKQYGFRAPDETEFCSIATR